MLLLLDVRGEVSFHNVGFEPLDDDVLPTVSTFVRDSRRKHAADTAYQLRAHLLSLFRVGGHRVPERAPVSKRRLAPEVLRAVGVRLPSTPTVV